MSDNNKRTIALTGRDARKLLLEASTLLANCVKVTLGPKGRTAILNHHMRGMPRITKDGVSVAKHLSSPDPFMHSALTLLTSSALETARTVGDGTTTATVLAESMIERGCQYLDEGKNSVDIQRGMALACKDILEELKKLSSPVEDKKSVREVAEIASNGEKTVGDIFEKAFDELNNKTDILLIKSSSPVSSLETVEGMHIDKGWVSPTFANNHEKRQCELDNPLILVCWDRLPNFNQILPITLDAMNNQRSLFIISRGMEGEALAQLSSNAVQGNIKVCVVNAPFSGERQKDIMDDICLYVGADLIAMNLGDTMSSITLDRLGTADKVIVNENSTYILSGKGDILKREARKNELKERLPSLQDDERLALQMRIGSLSNKALIVHVGGVTETEMKERYDRVEDALYAVRAALEEGIVVGGGFALYEAAESAMKNSFDTSYASLNSDEKAGYDMVIQSSFMPAKTIIFNAGKDSNKILKEAEELGMQYDSSKYEFAFIKERGIIDPTKVERCALENAVAVASTVLSTECIIAGASVEDLYMQTHPMARIGQHAANGGVKPRKSGI